jgi:ribosomal protein S18 acetylase RimI-like enzyme
MSEFRYLPISRLDESLLLPLMHEEAKAWMSDLNWDYSPIRQILISYAKKKLLPGYVAVDSNNAIGYTYFLVNQAKGIVGALYVAKTDHSQKAVEELISLAISSLKDLPIIQRIEAQILPFNNSNLTATFVRHGFRYFPRYFLDLDLHNHRKAARSSSALDIVPWSSAYLERAAEMSRLTYRDQIDAEICEDYRTKAGCENYLRSLIENPGCGVFVPDTSFIAVDRQGYPCGFLLCSQISNGAAMIPQIAVHPTHQATGVGNALMTRSFERLKAMGFHSVSLTVTEQNRRAFEWYQRLGFRIRKEFGAYIWQR